MGLLNRLYNYVNGTTNDGDEVRAEFDQLINVVNGNLDATNMADMTANESEATTGNTGKPHTLISRIVTMIKNITGLTNWYDTPAHSLNEMLPKAGGTMTGNLTMGLNDIVDPSYIKNSVTEILISSTGFPSGIGFELKPLDGIKNTFFYMNPDHLTANFQNGMKVQENGVDIAPPNRFTMSGNVSSDIPLDANTTLVLQTITVDIPVNKTLRLITSRNYIDDDIGFGGCSKLIYSTLSSNTIEISGGDNLENTIIEGQSGITRISFQVRNDSTSPHNIFQGSGWWLDLSIE